jgi:heparosan-N-sulfate-glucuronate 5-epimerase
MKLHTQNRLWRPRLPVPGFFVSEWQTWQQEKLLPHYTLAPLPCETSGLLPYALNMYSLLALPFGALDEGGVLHNDATERYPAVYHPTSIAQYALACWNLYLDTGEVRYKDTFMTQADWLIEHEHMLINGAGGWPILFSLPEYNASPMWLSALTQGNVISVLIRAYQLTRKEVFLQSARRAVHTFELETRDGGIAVPIGEKGVFFEEVGGGTASHILNGYILALFGLYDYVSCTHDTHVEALIQRSLYGLHTLIDDFDTGYWSLYDLRFRTPAPLFYHALHVTSLEALARLSGCQHCAALAEKWNSYQQSSSALLRYFVVSRMVRYRHALQRRLSHFCT